MKALSINSYYATEILEGFKTIECRSWYTNHRGDLLICANSTKNDFCLCGRAACIVDLIDIVPFTPDHLHDARMQEMPEGYPQKEFYAWKFKLLEYVVPVKIKGQLNLFNVDDEIISKITQTTPDTAHAAMFDFTNTPENGYNGYFQRFFNNIVEPAYYYYNQLVKQVHTEKDYSIDNTFCNNFFDLTGFEPGDIWDTIPKGFKRT